MAISAKPWQATPIDSFSSSSMGSRESVQEDCVRFGVLPIAPIIPSHPMAARSSSSIAVCCERVASVTRQGEPASCVLANQSEVRLPSCLVTYLAAGDEIAFPLSLADAVGAEIYITKAAVSGAAPCFYLAPIGYVSQPKMDSRHQHFVSAGVLHGGLGVTTVYLPCAALREYFYRLPATDSESKRPTLYELLGAPANATPAEMRVAFKLSRLELEAVGAPRAERVALERAFNIVAQPELRAGYDALLADPEAPAIFPYGGFGSLLVSGERSRDGKTFFARRILAFLPEQRQRRFHVPLRKCDFYEDRALCRDVGRKLEFWIDPAVLHRVWDASWNRWKHLLGAKMEVDATFVQNGKYRKRGDRWELVQWETGLPSRITVRLPADFEQQIEKARSSYRRFGQYSRALDQVRMCLEHRAIVKSELERICSGLRIPDDFDIAQISWRPDYDEFFYRQLSRRARRVYLFRNEYIFELAKAVVVETPQLGHATYVFAKPRNMDSFLHLYTHSSKDDIRRNRDNAGERLGFLKRVIHGTNPRAWLKELGQHLGEKIDVAETVSD